MKIKTYIVDTLAEVYPLIFRDLGNDAIILKSKSIKAPGFFGVFGRRKLEVIAAAELAGQTQTQKTPELSVTRSTESVSVGSDSQALLLKELSEVKGLIHSIAKGRNNIPSIPEPLVNCIASLREQEVDEEVIQFILKKLKLKIEDPSSVSSEMIEQELLAIIEQLFGEGISNEEDSSVNFVTLIGPTGVGKTTTIAKLAAARVLHGKQRVGLLTTDTYRIAAVEQLKTYGNILNIPLEVVTSPEDLQTATDNLKGCKVYFMDSTGRNYLEDEYIEEINQYLGYDAERENYLVLSMTTRWRDMNKITEKMKAVPIDKLILTKWDETTCYGAALNMLYHYPYPLAYLCNGQGVPQDIMTADPNYMAKKILGVG